MKPPRFIYITGCDGTGKTTQAHLLIEHLQAKGVKTRHLWLRFPFFTTIPMLAYARWRTLSWHEERDGVRHGHWDFQRSHLMRTLFPWMLLLDATLATFLKIYLPLWFGRTIVCERFVLDMLVDLAVSLDDNNIHRKLPGRLYFNLLPRDSIIFVLDLDEETIRVRRADLLSDHKLEARLRAFRQMAEDFSYPVIINDQSIHTVSQQIQDKVCKN